MKCWAENINFLGIYEMKILSSAIRNNFWKWYFKLPPHIELNDPKVTAAHINIFNVVAAETVRELFYETNTYLSGLREFI